MKGGPAGGRSRWLNAGPATTDSPTTLAAMTAADSNVLPLGRLEAAAFARYGTVIAAPGQGTGGTGRWINGGTSERFELVEDLALGRDGGQARLALFRAAPRHFPQRIDTLECHWLGSQTFLPLGELRFIVVVALPGTGADGNPDPATLAAFLSDGRQGVTLAAGTWHHALLAVDGGDFVVIERVAATPDCDLAALSFPRVLAAPFD